MTKSELIEAGITHQYAHLAMQTLLPSMFPIAAKEWGQNRTPEIAAGLMLQEVLRHVKDTDKNRTDLFDVRVLEVGTGSGYVTALLRYALPRDVMLTSVERVQDLHNEATNNLLKAGMYDGHGSIATYYGDVADLVVGNNYDVILLTCGAPRQWAESFLAHAPTVIGPIGNTPSEMTLGTLLRTTPPTWVPICAVPGANPLKRGTE